MANRKKVKLKYTRKKRKTTTHVISKLLVKKILKNTSQTNMDAK